MGLRVGSWAKVWSLRQNGKLYSGQVSVSRKKQDGSGYDNTFSGYVNFGSKAAEKLSACGLPEKYEKDAGTKPVGIFISSSPDITTWYNS